MTELDAISQASSRYCSHMNHDHSDAVLYYVQVFGGQPSARHATMLAINAQEMDFTFDTLYKQGVRLRIPFKPALQSTADVRPRLIGMMNEALDRLGLSRVPVDLIQAPCIRVTVISLLVGLIYYVHFNSLENLPSTLVFLKTGMLEKIVCVSTIYLVPVCHAAEAMFMLRPKLRRYRVGFKNSTYWYASCCLAGYFAISQFEQLVKEEVQRKTEKPHHG
ncbi:hypothetical protein DFH28DRAFT_957890 [Melampsora americana]|nr:hypothetical protein DFH28DRAFT_957890 [Melampsora americana]